MMSCWSRRWTTALVALALAGGGCIGPFNLTRRLYRWNVQVGDKWEQEFVFILLAWAPVYGLVVAADALVFNSMEFWTGRNPVDPPQASIPRQRRLVRGDTEAVVTYAVGPDGPRLVIAQFERGESAGGVTVTRQDGYSVGVDEEGKVLFTARAFENGGIVVWDGSGAPIASYPPSRVRAILASADRIAQR